MAEFGKKWKQIKARFATLTIRQVGWLAPVISLVAWVVVHLVSILYGFSIMDLSRETLIATKTTFGSIIVVLGMFQYDYFSDEVLKREEQEKSGDDLEERQRVVLELSMRLALIFAIVILVFASLILDLIPLLLPCRSAPLIHALSQSAFLGSLALVGVMLILFLWVIQRQARYYGKVY